MASSKDLEPSRENQLAQRRAAEQDVLLREVDDAVRQDRLSNAIVKYKWPAIGLFVLALAGLGGGLWYRDYRQGELDRRSETLVTAYDQLEAGRTQEASAQLAPVAADGGSAAAASAKLALAAIALRENRTAEAYKQFEAVAADGNVPQPYRDLATVRLMASRFDQLKPEDVIARLKPLAVPGNPWFGSAGEMVAMAYLKQNREDLAGPLLASIAKDETVPQTLRSRTRQLAGLLGFDAVVDVDQTLTQLRREQTGAGAVPAPAPAAAPAPAP